MAELAGLGALFADSEASCAAREPKRAQLTPGTVSQLVAKPPQPPSRPPADRNEIWAENEVDADDGFDADDGRAAAAYELVYKQRVSPQDMFLGIDPTRNPGTASCEDLVVRIQLPGAKASELDLEVQRTRLTLRTPRHKVRIHLPKAVDDERGNAKWVADKECLEVTLPVVDTLFLGDE
ncbi:hypothetical protein KFE25_003762 [Diacronema lutheri]|uniref:PIH1D1/2/3 CS-like domain-containing protein n=1 Tax=Diacronema lutheri TaxID=2081491 RepID=A0A8J5X1M0_DIALT|nr:hypothetical protein KFE25_003762 [Diacronema lutheri]